MNVLAQFALRVAPCCLFASAPLAASAQSTSPAPPAVGAGMLAEAAQVLGLKQCRPVLERLAPMVAQDSTAQDLIVDRNLKSKDEGPVFLLMGMQRPLGAAALTISAMPEADGSCSFVAERISMAPYTCESVARTELPTYRATRLLPSFTVYADPKDPGATVTMLDSPPGCIIIRRHVQFRWRPGAAP
jgi:hypothetical protein